MKEEFLNNFHKRMEKLSYSFLIDNKVTTLGTFNKYDIDTMDGINIVYTLMCFIMDKSLKDEECTISNMVVFLDNILLNYYDKELDNRSVYDIVRFIVIKVLRNDGNRFVFKTKDYNENSVKAFEFHLLNQKPSKEDNNKSTYYLTQEGYRLILGALEVDEKTQIDINQMVLELSLKKKNFSQGLMAIENLNNLVTSQVNIINQFIIKTRENIFTIDQKEFENNFVKNLDVLKEQNNKFDEIKDTIVQEEERIHNSNKEITEEGYTSLKQLGKIKKMLILTTHKSGDLIGKHFEFKKEYKKALEEASLYYSSKRINIKDDILKQLEKNAESLGDSYKIFSSLFSPRVPKKFNVNYMFNPQKLYLKEDDEEETFIEEIDFESKEQERIDDLRSKYENIVSNILSFIISEKETDLRSYIGFLNNHKDKYKTSIPNIRMVGEVLIDLLRIGNIDVLEIIGEEDKTYEDSDIIFDLRNILVKEFTEKYKLHISSSLEFTKDNAGDKVEIIEFTEAKKLSDDSINKHTAMKVRHHEEHVKTGTYKDEKSSNETSKLHQNKAKISNEMDKVKAREAIDKNYDKVNDDFGIINKLSCPNIIMKITKGE